MIIICEFHTSQYVINDYHLWISYLQVCHEWSCFVNFIHASMSWMIIICEFNTCQYVMNDHHLWISYLPVCHEWSSFVNFIPASMSWMIIILSPLMIRIRDVIIIMMDDGVEVVIAYDNMTPTFKAIPSKQRVHSSGPVKVSMVWRICIRSIHPQFLTYIWNCCQLQKHGKCW